MARMHLLEIEDQPWCPAAVRDGVTDVLQMMQTVGDAYSTAAPLLARALRRTGRSRVVDLCSGGGGPWRQMLGHIAEQGLSVDVLLTDLYPNRAAFAQAEEVSGGRIRGWPGRVDARQVPEELKGLRTMFTGFHHFNPEDARRVLVDAVRCGEGIAVFELTDRSIRNLLMLMPSPLLPMLLTPFMRPFRWSRLFWTYGVPVIPSVLLFDGIVSCLRTYSPEELGALTRDLGSDGYTWEIGRVRTNVPALLTYLIGYPPVARR